ncbi:MAG: hypothetical protein V1850_00980 [Candidatus Bathyarchaeota archaeon]
MTYILRGATRLLIDYSTREIRVIKKNVSIQLKTKIAATVSKLRIVGV